MWLARVGGLLLAAGVCLALAGWYRTDIAPGGAYAALFLIALVALVTAAVLRRRKADGRATAFLRWFAVLGLFTALFGMMIPKFRGVSPPDARARAELSRLASAQLAYTADSGQPARTPAQLAGRYEPSTWGLGAGDSLVMQSSSDGWVANLVIRRTGQTCTVYDGPAPVSAATEPWTPACTTQPHRGLFWIGWVIAVLGAALGWISLRRPPAVTTPLEPDSSQATTVS